MNYTRIIIIIQSFTSISLSISIQNLSMEICLGHRLLTPVVHSELKDNEHADMKAKIAAADLTLSQQQRHRPLKLARARCNKWAVKRRVTKNGVRT